MEGQGQDGKARAATCVNGQVSGVHSSPFGPLEVRLTWPAIRRDRRRDRIRDRVSLLGIIHRGEPRARRRGGSDRSLGMNKVSRRISPGREDVVCSSGFAVNYAEERASPSNST